MSFNSFTKTFTISLKRSNKFPISSIMPHWITRLSTWIIAKLWNNPKSVYSSEQTIHDSHHVTYQPIKHIQTEHFQPIKFIQHESR